MMSYFHSSCVQVHGVLVLEGFSLQGILRVPGDHLLDVHRMGQRQEAESYDDPGCELKTEENKPKIMWSKILSAVTESINLSYSHWQRDKHIRTNTLSTNESTNNL